MEATLVAAITAIATAIAAVAGTYLKMRPKTEKSHTPCPQHSALEQKFLNGGRRMEKIEETLGDHGKTLTHIQIGVGELSTKLDMLMK